MRIEFTRTGGFAGVRVAKTLDTDAMPAAEANHLTALVESARFFELPGELRSSGSDQFQYKLTVEMGGKSHTVVVDERAVPPTLAPLVNELLAAARKR